MPTTRDYYEILNVDRNATADEVKGTTTCSKADEAGTSIRQSGPPTPDLRDPGPMPGRSQ